MSNFDLVSLLQEALDQNLGERDQKIAAALAER
jgi:hypothetical protein